MKHLLILFSLVALYSFKKVADPKVNFPKTFEPVLNLPKKDNVWVFILAGQSNMAGRGFVEPMDTIPNQRVFSITSDGRLVYAKEPLHFYEPELTGLDCGLSFGKTFAKNIPDSISVLVIPTAIGGSSASQWVGDSLYRNVQLLSNFKEKVAIGNQYGVIKGILWHQGESDANEKDLPFYDEKIAALFATFRNITANDHLPILMGMLAPFPKNEAYRDSINQTILAYSITDNQTAVIDTHDLEHKGDTLHFNSAAQRLMGERFAETYLKKFP